VALDEVLEVGRWRRAPQREDAPDRVGPEDAGRRGRRPPHGLADSSKTTRSFGSSVPAMSTGYARINIDDVDDLAAQ
jgi:hypothetical protein